MIATNAVTTPAFLTASIGTNNDDNDDNDDGDADF